MSDIRTTPPNWQKDALPSKLGWLHPVTGELLVSIPGGVIQKKINTLEVIDETVQSSMPLIDETVKQLEVVEMAPETVLLTETTTAKKSTPRKTASKKSADTEK